MIGTVIVFGLIPVVIAFIAGFVFLTVSEGDITNAAQALQKHLKMASALSLAGIIMCIWGISQGVLILIAVGTAVSAPTAFVLGTQAAAKRRQK